MGFWGLEKGEVVFRGDLLERSIKWYSGLVKVLFFLAFIFVFVFVVLTLVSRFLEFGGEGGDVFVCFFCLFIYKFVIVFRLCRMLFWVLGYSDKEVGLVIR